MNCTLGHLLLTEMRALSTHTKLSGHKKTRSEHRQVGIHFFLTQAVRLTKRKADRLTGTHRGRHAGNRQTMIRQAGRQVTGRPRSGRQAGRHLYRLAGDRQTKIRQAGRHLYRLAGDRQTKIRQAG